MASAFAAWGYGAKSSGGRETRSALRYFGLITLEGDGETGKVKLTEKALRIILDKREDQTEKRKLIRELALTPAVHKALFEQFPHGLKSDATVEHYLIFEQSYNQSAASEIVAEYRATADYAGLYDPANVTVNLVPASLDVGSTEPEGDEGARNSPLPASPKPPSGSSTITPEVKVMTGERELTKGILAKDASFRLIVSGNIGVKEIERLIKKLEIDKEILAEQDAELENEDAGYQQWKQGQ